MLQQLLNYRCIVAFSKNLAPSIVDAQPIFRKFLDVLPSNGTLLEIIFLIHARIDICFGAGFLQKVIKTTPLVHADWVREKNGGSV